MQDIQKEEVLGKLQDIIIDHLSVEEVPVEETIKGLGGDSLDSVDIISNIERTYNVRISDELAAQMYDLNIGEITDKLAELLTAKAAAESANDNADGH